MTNELIKEIQGLADEVGAKAFLANFLPVNLEAICQHYGILLYQNYDMKVTERRLGGEVASMLLQDMENSENLTDMPKAVIYVNKDDDPAKKRFNIAHELGHYFLHKKGKLSVTYRDEISEKETEANRFALELLLPENAIRKEYQKHPLLVPREFARIFAVSSAMIETRLDQLSLPYMKYLV